MVNTRDAHVWNDETGWQPNPNYNPLIGDDPEGVEVTDANPTTVEDDDDTVTEIELEQAIKAAISEHEDEFHSDEIASPVGDVSPEETPGG